LFSSPLFHSCGGDKREHEPGDIKCRDWRYWLPLIALYSGARLGEIAQLLVKDVLKKDGHWCFHICKDGEIQKSVKTAGSERIVPIHPELIGLGLIDYHERSVSEGHISLFPEIKADTRGFMSGRPSKFFQNYFRAIGLKVDKSVNCHSLRHGIADAF
jgi:integrase